MPRDPGSRRSAPDAEVARRNRRSTRARPRFEGLEHRALLSASGVDETVAPALDGFGVEAGVVPSALVGDLSSAGERAETVVSDALPHRHRPPAWPPPHGADWHANVVALLANHGDPAGAVGGSGAGAVGSGTPGVRIDPEATSWILDELVREFATPSGMTFPGGVYLESWLGDDGAAIPLKDLPGDAPLTMIGSIRNGDGPDYYSFRPDAEGFRLQFTAFDPGSDLADLLMVYDGSEGLIVGVTVSSTENTVTLDFRSTDGRVDREVIVRIGPDGPDPGKGLEHYALTVLPGTPSEGTDLSAPGPALPSTDETPQDPPVSLPDPGAPPRWPDGPPSSMPWEPGAPSTEDVSQSTNGDGGIDEAGGVAVVVDAPAPGPLPALAAAPFGGILGFGDPALLVGRHEAAVIDLDLIGLPSLASHPADRIDATGAGGGSSSPGLEALDGNSELPVVAAAHPRVSLEEFPPELVDAAMMVPALLAIDPAVVAAEPGADGAAGLGDGAAVPAEPPSPPQRVLRWTVAGLTALMAAHLLLPDLGLLLPLVRLRQRGRRRWLGDVRGSWCRPPRSIG